ncbi:MAG: PP2C family protein-serine/threonine phosphatase [Candidatus Eisenbacteria bacterium]
MLSALNHQLCAIQRPDRFVSLFCAELDPWDRSLRYANGGHLQPILVRAEGQVERLDRSGLLLGIREPIAYEAGEVRLSPGDVLLLFTDGVIERGGPDGTFGEVALQSFVARYRHLSAEDLVGRILEELERVEPAGEMDDTTLLALKLL